MNVEEEIAKQCIALLGIAAESIQFEPNGPKTFPDFCIDESIGVEVRRLNRNFVRQGETAREGMEILAEKLTDWLAYKMPSLYEKASSHTWFVCVSFSRKRRASNADIEYRSIRSRVRSALDNFLDESDTVVEKKLLDDDDLILRVRRASGAFSTKFVLGSVSDLDAGGYVYAELTRNIAISVEEKAAKVARNSQLYERWWLVLVNRVTPVVSEPDLIDAWRDTQIEHPFERILIVNKLANLSFVDLLEGKGAT